MSKEKTIEISEAHRKKAMELIGNKEYRAAITELEDALKILVQLITPSDTSVFQNMNNLTGLAIHCHEKLEEWEEALVLATDLYKGVLLVHDTEKLGIAIKKLGNLFEKVDETNPNFHQTWKIDGNAEGFGIDPSLISIPEIGPTNLLVFKALIYIETHRYDKVDSILNEALTVYKRINYYEGSADVIRMQGFKMIHLGKYEKAIEKIQSALDMYKICCKDPRKVYKCEMLLESAKQRQKPYFG